MTDLRLQVSRQVRLLRDSRTVPNVSDPSTRSQGRRYLVFKTPRRPLRLSWDGNRIILHAQHVGPDNRVLPKYRRAGVLQCAQSIPALRKSLGLIRLVYGHDPVRLAEQEQVWRTMVSRSRFGELVLAETNFSSTGAVLSELTIVSTWEYR
jgi:hypothetical protein